MASSNQESGSEWVPYGSFRVLETFDRAADGPHEPLRQDVREKISRALKDFPELANETVTVGRLDEDSDAKGRAWFNNRLVFLPTDSTTSFVTMYHELAHLAIAVRNECGEDVPITSERYCSILSVSRMPTELIDEDRIPYLGEPEVPKREWPSICRRSLEYREDHHAYIKKCQEWLGIEGGDD